VTILAPHLGGLQLLSVLHFLPYSLHYFVGYGGCVGYQPY
jgi:hypothetical protein